MLPLTNDIKKRIRLRIKNHLDISELIKDLNIRGADLSNSIIKDFTRMKEDMSNIDLTNATIGEEGKVSKICSCKILNSMFVNTKFIGKWFFRRNNCTGSNFNGASCPNVEWQYSDMRQCTFCETLLRLGTEYFYKTQVDLNLFKDWTKYLNIEVKFKETPLNKSIEEKI